MLQLPDQDLKICVTEATMKSLFCLKCLCCCDLPDCADFMNAIGMPYPDHGCSDYNWAGPREVFYRLLEVL